MDTATRSRSLGRMKKVEWKAGDSVTWPLWWGLPSECNILLRFWKC